MNYLFQFLFQELKDTSKVRRYVVKKLTEEFEDIKKTKIGKLFVQDISVCIENNKKKKQHILLK